jgi:hypothetical protein
MNIYNVPRDLPATSADLLIPRASVGLRASTSFCAALALLVYIAK